MIIMGQEMPLTAIRQQIASGIDIIVQLGRLRDKSRRVLEIAEIDGFKDGEIRINTLYKFEETGCKSDGSIVGKLVKKSNLRHTDKLQAAGLEI